MYIFLFIYFCFVRLLVFIFENFKIVGEGQYNSPFPGRIYQCQCKLYQNNNTSNDNVIINCYSKIYRQITVYIYMLYTCIPRHGHYRLGGESQYCQGDTDDETEDCPVPAAPGGEDFLPLTQLDPFIDFQPSQIFRRSQNGAPNENRGKEPPNIAYVFKVLFSFY